MDLLTHTLARCLVTATTLCLSIISFAGPKAPAATPIRYDQYVVKIETRSAHIFDPALSEGHGTGFIVNIDEKKDSVTVFTNRHVVDTGALSARELTVHVTADTGRPESVRARLVYTSTLHDFAVISFHLSDLSRTKKRIRNAPLPPKGHVLGQFLDKHLLFQGRTVVAFGNPLGSNNIMTSGEVSGISVTDHGSEYTPMGSVFIQTTAPINPGNSGGPLIDYETGAVVGMNTMIISGANNVGFSIPIELLTSDYEAFQKNPNIAFEKVSTIIFGIAPLSELKMTGDLHILKSGFPGYIDSHDHVLRVQDSRNPNLQTGDLVIQVNGVSIGSSFYQFKVIATHSEELALKIIRNGKIEEVKIKTPSERIARIREDLDFVMISGLIFQTSSFKEVFPSGRDIKSNVFVSMIDPHNPVVSFGNTRYPLVGSVLVGVYIDGNHYQINKLLDLKIALARNPHAKAIRVDVRETILVHDSSGNRGIALTRYGTNALNGSITYNWIPMTDVITPRNFSINSYIKQFSFEQGEPETRDWRRFVRKGQPSLGSACEEQLLAASL